MPNALLEGMAIAPGEQVLCLASSSGEPPTPAHDAPQPFRFAAPRGLARLSARASCPATTQTLRSLVPGSDHRQQPGARNLSPASRPLAASLPTLGGLRTNQPRALACRHGVNSWCRLTERGLAAREPTEHSHLTAVLRQISEPPDQLAPLCHQVVTGVGLVELIEDPGGCAKLFKQGAGVVAKPVTLQTDAMRSASSRAVVSRRPWFSSCLSTTRSDTAKC